MAARQIKKQSDPGVTFEVAQSNTGLYEETTTKWLIYVDSKGNVTELDETDNIVRPFVGKSVIGTRWIRTHNKGFCLEN